MRKFLLFTAAVIFISPATAQENVIRVIGEDGSVQEIELKPKRRSSIPDVPKIEPPKIEPPKIVKPAPPPEPALPPEPDMPEIKTEMPEQLKAIVEPLPDKVPEEPAEIELEVEPVPDKSDKEEQVSSEVDEPAQETVEWNQDRTGAMMMKPGRKPVVPYRHAKPDYSVLEPAKPSGPITKERAIAIALDKAPPASSVMAIPQVQEGRPVYVVKFRTENGPLEVTVDYATGEIIR